VNKVLVTIASVATLFLSMWIFQDIVAPVFRVVLLVIAGIFVLGAVLGVIWVVHFVIEDMRKRRIERQKAQFVSYQDGFGMTYIHDVVSGMIENLTVYPGSHRNGHWEDPHPVAAAGWHVVMGKRHSESPVALLQAPEPEPQLDLLTIMTQPTQSYAFIGGQQVGKTYQARKIAGYWANRGIKPVVIGPKWDRGEWSDCVRVGGNLDYVAVLSGLRAVNKLAQKRHADKTKLHKEQPVQPVFIDDWTDIRHQLAQDAEDFITQATVLYASVNIILYFIIHADTNNAWGVGKVGAALHQNFVKLIVQPGFNSAGVIDRSKNIGWLQMPGESKKDRRQVPLFSEYGQQQIQPARQAIEPDLIIQPNEQPRTEQQRRVVELWNRSNKSEDAINAIAERVYGHGGAQRQRTKDTIERYG
jgi:hypothetical protein